MTSIWQGARGILVNITAGLDLSLGEFSEVGDTIEEFASEEATVVVGTVIDPDMTEELKVTVVATGLGSEAVRAPLQVVDSAPAKPAVPAEVELEPDYKEFDRPPAMRNKPRRAAAVRCRLLRRVPARSISIFPHFCVARRTSKTYRSLFRCPCYAWRRTGTGEERFCCVSEHWANRSGDRRRAALR